MVVIRPVVMSLLLYGMLGELATYDFVKHELMHRGVFQSESAASSDDDGGSVEGVALHVVASLITGVVAATGECFIHHR